MDFLTAFWWSDSIGSIYGILFNLLLIVAIVRTSKDGFHSFSYLVLASSVNDMLFSAYALTIQHLVKIDDGVIYSFPRGVEKYVPTEYLPIFAFLHLFSITNTFTTQPAIYQYKYLIVSSMGCPPSPYKLLRNLFIAALGAGAAGLTFALSTMKTEEHGKEYYIEKLSPLWFNNDGTTDFMYAADWSDIITKIYFVAVACVCSLSNVLTLYYIMASMRVVHTTVKTVSSTTKALQRQFTKALISQTIVLALFAMLPSTFYMGFLVFKLKSEYLGIIVMWPLSYFSAVNALLPLIFIRAYRTFVLNLVGIRLKSDKVVPSSEKVLASAINDIIFSAYALTIQHLVRVDDCIVYAFPRGIEKHVKEEYLPIFAFFHLFTITNTFTTQPAIHHYKYLIVTAVRTKPSTLILIRNFAGVGAGLTGLSFAMSMMKTKDYGDRYYEKRLTLMWFNLDGSTDFLYAANSRDDITKLYFLTVGVVCSVSNVITLYYIVAAMKAVNKTVKNVSATTKVLQRQFSKNLISQTIVLALFAMLPSLFYMAALILRIKSEYMGIVVMWPLSYFSAAAAAVNAILLLLFVRVYRHFVLRLFRIRPEPESVITSSVTITEITKNSELYVQRGNSV
ncbi:unnamed protein product [Bursaphelenchus okinawaensis]|uniref:Uncharacterized protein n=1 Tax=Bursaphelenchus okinawaensis TaxID=465554 RepID=A0A811KII4_9BILA|nr:unnamed protein product [Bursaphelenchus okinawaensis]CAG9105306.1 unnamed protein product [Bursaphelenchus okinawaensis]